MTCRNCGADPPDGAQFCASCGAKQVGAQDFVGTLEDAGEAAVDAAWDLTRKAGKKARPLAEGAVRATGDALSTLGKKVRRPHGPEIEEVFLVSRDGILICHLSRSITVPHDEDVLGAMLTAVQNFVKDAFQYGRNQELRTLELGDFSILFERGEHVCLAIAIAGQESEKLRFHPVLILLIPTFSGSLFSPQRMDQRRYLDIQVDFANKAIRALPISAAASSRTPVALR